MRYLWLAILLVGCGRLTVEKSLVATEEVRLYVDNFIQDGASQGVTLSSSNLVVALVPHITVKGEAKEGRVVGLCQWGDTLRVYLDKPYWDNAEAWTRKQLVYHELGHCLLNRGHEDGFTPGGIPTSIMLYKTFEGAVLASNEGYYIKELFSKERGALGEYP